MTSDNSTLDLLPNINGYFIKNTERKREKGRIKFIKIRDGESVGKKKKKKKAQIKI